MPLSSLPTGTVSHRRGDRTRTADTDSESDRQTGRGGQHLVARDGGPHAGSRPESQSKSRPQSPSPPSLTRSGHGGRGPQDEEAAERIEELEAEVESLRRELARREADHQEIIHRYEHVLSESDSSPTRRQADGQTTRAKVAAHLSALRYPRDGRSLRERLRELVPW